MDDLGDTRPIVLWLHSSADLRMACVNSVAIVGSRAATAVVGTSASPDSEKLDNRGLLSELFLPQLLVSLYSRAPRQLRHRQAAR